MITTISIIMGTLSPPWTTNTYLHKRICSQRLLGVCIYLFDDLMRVERVYAPKKRIVGQTTHTHTRTCTYACVCRRVCVCVCVCNISNFHTARHEERACMAFCWTPYLWVNMRGDRNRTLRQCKIIFKHPLAVLDRCCVAFVRYDNCLCGFPLLSSPSCAQVNCSRVFCFRMVVM